MTDKDRVLEIYPNAHVDRQMMLYSVRSYAAVRPGFDFYGDSTVNPEIVWSVAWKTIQRDMLRKLES